MIDAREMPTVWVIRAGDRSRLVQTFLDSGEIGVGFPELPDGRDVDRSKALRLLEPDPEAPPPEAEAAAFLSFVRRIEVGDVVVMPDPAAKGLVCGVVAGDYTYRDELEPDRHRHRRPVEWRRRLPTSALPERLANLPRTRHAVADVPDGRLRELALQCCRLELGDDPHDRPRGAVSGGGGPRRSRAPRRPPRATIAERRCTSCFVSKPAELFEEGSDRCRDCE